MALPTRVFAMPPPFFLPARAAARLVLVASIALPWLVARAGEPATPNDPESDPQKLAPVEVTGSRIKLVEGEGPSPIKIVTRAELELSGRTSLAEALRDLPEAGFSTINENGTVAAVRGSTALNLRDLGANNTLIIVNGRRAVLTGRHADGNTFVDLNRFPISMVERVEVLKDGASAVYGADATAGVVNVILRKDFKGVEASFTYGNAFDTDVGEKAWSLFAGAASGKASGTIALSYYERGALKATDTEFSGNADLSLRYAAKDPKYASRVAAGFYDLRSGTGPQARINGVYGTPVNGFNGVNIPGLPVGFQITRLPGTGGVVFGLGTAASPSFTNPPQVGTGGQFSAPITATYVPQILTAQSNPSNLYNFVEHVWLTPQVKRSGLNATLHYDLSKDVTLYSEFFYALNKSHIELAPPPIATIDDNQIYVPRTNYWNPFGVDVQFAYRPVDFGPRKSDVTNTTYQFLAGAKGRLRDRWDWDVGYTYGHDHSKDRTPNAISESRLRAVLARSTPDALNIFGGANFKNDPAVYNAIRVPTEQAGYSALAVADAKVSGDLVEIPTGTIGAAVYAEWRKEKFGASNDALSSRLDDIVAQVRLDDPIDAWRTVKSVAAELRVPLVKPAKYFLLHRADLNLAARYESFSDGYDSGVKPFAGLRYQPIRDLVLRGSLSRAFRAPTLPQLYGGVHEGYLNNLPDLRRPQALTGDPFDGPAQQRLIRSTGNRDLTPENADTYQFGFVYDVPLRPLKGLSLGATYFHIEQTNVITTLGTSFIRLNEAGGGTADFVVRDPTPEIYFNRTGAPILILAGPNGAAAVIQPGQGAIVAGRIRYLRDIVVNLARQKVEGYDFELNYTKRSPRWGRFSFRSAVAYYSFFGYTRTDELFNQIGQDALPRVRTATSLVWMRRDWTAGVFHNYLGPYGDFNRNGYEVDAYQTAGFFVGYDIPPGLLRGFENTRLTFGIDNVFDENPPLYDDAVGYDQRFIGRPAGRFWFASLRRSF
jgi:outer membrane receptor protein involved in Fe transport